MCRRRRRTQDFKSELPTREKPDSRRRWPVRCQTRRDPGPDGRPHPSRVAKAPSCRTEEQVLSCNSSSEALTRSLETGRR